MVECLGKIAESGVCGVVINFKIYNIKVIPVCGRKSEGIVVEGMRGGGISTREIKEEGERNIISRGAWKSGAGAKGSWQSAKE